MTKEGTMNLEQFHEKFGIKRIDFSKVKKSNIEKQYGEDELICPYCEATIDFESEDIARILEGEAHQCPHCDKWFYAEGEVRIDTTCIPMDQAVMEHRISIEQSYSHIDKCIECGLRFDDNRYGNVEWETYYNYAKPYFENLEMDGKK
jgi:hypothetical protein